MELCCYINYNDRLNDYIFCLMHLLVIRYMSSKKLKNTWPVIYHMFKHIASYIVYTLWSLQIHTFTYINFRLLRNVFIVLRLIVPKLCIHFRLSRNVLLVLRHDAFPSIKAWNVIIILGLIVNTFLVWSHLSPSPARWRGGAR